MLHVLVAFYLKYFLLYVITNVRVRTKQFFHLEGTFTLASVESWAKH